MKNEPTQTDSGTRGNQGGETPALEFRNITHVYGAMAAVKDLSLTVAPSETVCLLGPSGCGKTTALRVAAGLESPSAGEVWMSGRQLNGGGRAVPPEHRKIGLVFQDYALFPHMNVLENVIFGLERMAERTRRERALDTLALVGMADYAENYPHMLSGGQQQRVALARALAPSPAVVLLDEPFSGLDARLRDSVRDKTFHALRQSGAAALMVTHDAEEAMYMADRIAVMKDGSLVQAGAPRDLYQKPCNPFVAAFFGEVNRISGTVQRGSVETAVGVLPAPGMSNGAPVEVLVRPEALRLSPAVVDSVGPGYAKVLSARLLGRTSLVHLCTCATTGEELHLHARVPGAYLPVEETIQAIELDQSQAFVFPGGAAK